MNSSTKREPMATVEVLRAARALIDTPEKWTQGMYARDADGEGCDSRDLAARCFCAAGAISRAVKDSPTPALYARTALRRASGIAGLVSPWNDAPERTHAEVLAAFDAAIACEAA